MDWSTLTGNKSAAGSLANWLNVGTLTQAVATLVIEEAESWVYARLRHWRMMAAPTSGTFTVGSDRVTLPSDLLEPDLFKLSGIYQGDLVHWPRDRVVSAWGYDGSGNRITGTPCAFYFDATGFQFDVVADLAYPYVLTYYAQPAALSQANPTNFLTSKYPRLFRCACMTAAAEWAKDTGQGNIDRTYWAQMAQGELDAAQQESDRSRRTMNSGPAIIDLG